MFEMVETTKLEIVGWVLGFQLPQKNRFHFAAFFQVEIRRIFGICFEIWEMNFGGSMFDF